ncbi:hypothetical protein L218DRAFT_996038 [Marasmius fiardii PR-910]|nr:hypothetical protein L218DRAFT_996038 [Marasmius fiardii PR-910]
MSSKLLSVTEPTSVVNLFLSFLLPKLAGSLFHGIDRTGSSLAVTGVDDDFAHDLSQKIPGDRLPSEESEETDAETAVVSRGLRTGRERTWVGVESHLALQLDPVQNIFAAGA